MKAFTRFKRYDIVAILFGLMFAITMLGVAATDYMIARYDLSGLSDQSLLREKARLLEGGQATTAEVAERIFDRERRRSIGAVGHRLEDAQGHWVAGKVLPIAASSGFSTVRFREDWPKIMKGRALSLTLQDGGRLLIVAESETLEDFETIIMPLFWATLGIAVIAGIMVSLLLTRFTAVRLAGLRKTVDAIVAGDMSQRVPIDRLGGMYAEQAISFNHMLDRIEALMTNLRQMSADVAHDLRTPLTRLRSMMADAAKPALDEPKRAQLIDAAQRECDTVLTIFAALLRISEIEAGRRRSHVRHIDLSALIEDIFESMEPVAQDYDHRLRLVPLPHARVQGDPDLLSQLLINLIENAIYHTPVGTNVEIGINPSATAGVATLFVRDDGPGIAPEDRARVVRRFVRLRPGRSGPGNGLGLALADTIARFHEGQLMLVDNQPGLIVQVILPNAVVTSRTSPSVHFVADGETLTDTSTSLTLQKREGLYLQSY
jgi:signal transduction histidine kinase